MTNLTLAVDDEFGNQIAAGLLSYAAALQCARRYLSAHYDAPCVEIYEDCLGGESWIVSRDEVA